MASPTPPPRDDKPTGSEGFSSPKREEPSALMWVGVGMELAGAVGILALLGWGVDQWLGTKPWGLLTGGSIGIVGGMYNLIKQAIKANR